MSHEETPDMGPSNTQDTAATDRDAAMASGKPRHYPRGTDLTHDHIPPKQRGAAGRWGRGDTKHHNPLKG